MAKIHFITGKGGVGKSTLAASFASHLEQSGQGPVLLIEVQGSGYALKLLGLQQVYFQNTHVPGFTDLWASRIRIKETFRQYFEVLVGLGPSTGLANSLKDKIVDVVLENKIVTAFVDVCPGLEPAVLLGKIHWEATQGKTPEEHFPWKHVVVDAPATGHGLMLFKSTFALTEVFQSGHLLKQASAISSYVKDVSKTQIFLVTTPEELPARETVELFSSLLAMGLPTPHIIINRFPQEISAHTPSAKSPLIAEWQREVMFEKELMAEASEILSNLSSQLPPETKRFIVSESTHDQDPHFLTHIRLELANQGIGQS